MKIFSSILSILIFSFPLMAQKIEIEHNEKTPKPSVLEEGKFKIFLVNDTNEPITLFLSHHKEYGGCEATSSKSLNGEVLATGNKWKPMDTNSRFDTRAFATLKPNTKKWISTMSIGDKKPGTYILKYRIKQDPSTVDTRYAKSTAASSKAKSINKMDIEGVLEYTIEALEKKPFEVREVSYEEAIKQKPYRDFDEAEYDPSSIFSMVLSIKNNEEAREIFSKLAPLKNIKKLGFIIDSKDPITFPESISNLPLLHFSINIKDNNKLVSFPEDFLNSGSLRFFSISGQPSGDLSFLKVHSNLEQLFLEKIDTDKLDWIEQTPNIKELHIVKCPITEFPGNFKKLTKLSKLDIRDNKLTSIEHFPISTDLETLIIVGNQITALPAAFSQLKGLKKLECRDNKIESIPNDLSQLELLKEVILVNNNLEEFPKGLTTAKNIKDLNLSGNKISKIPLEISNLTSLENIDFSKNRIYTFPSGLCKISTIRILKVQNNQIENIPKEIDQLKAMRRFNFENNKISILPDSFFNMQLYKIYSQGNQLNKKQLKKLRKSFGRALKS